MDLNGKKVLSIVHYDFDEVKSIVRSMNADGKLICEICHAGWVLISAGRPPDLPAYLKTVIGK